MQTIWSRQAIAVLCASVAMAQDKPAPAPTPPSEAIASAMAKAKAHNKRVLIVFEQQEQDATKALATTMKSNRELARLVSYEFDVVCVDAGHAADVAKAHDFAAATLDPPAVLVLDAAGKPLAKLAADAIFTGDAVDAKRLMAELGALKVAPLDAEKVLADGLATAKNSDRRVFIRFDAPG